MIDDEAHPISLASFVTNATKRRCEPDELEVLASMYKAPAVPSFEYVQEEVTDDIMALVRKAGGMAYVIWRDGPKNGSDRSISLWKLAHRCRDADLTPSQAAEVVRSADLRWGKYWMRKDPDMEIHRMIAKAYGA
jgi:hypothetical protein